MNTFNRSEMREELKELKNSPPLTSEQLTKWNEECLKFEVEQEEYWDEWERDQAKQWNKIKDRQFTL